MEEKTLYLPLKKKWYEMIESNEYKVISREYFLTVRHENMIKNWLKSKR